VNIENCNIPPKTSLLLAAEHYDSTKKSMGPIDLPPWNSLVYAKSECERIINLTKEKLYNKILRTS
jgi:hypothetical protein